MLTLDQKILPFARKIMREGETDTRSAAVQAVDGYHGYTMEFAASPAHHRDLYDLIEEQLNELSQ